MGDDWKKAQFENFRKGRDRAKRDAAEPRLIDRPEVTKTVYHIDPDEGKSCRVGEVVRAMAPDGTGPVVVARGFERIGVIDGEGGTVLRRALTDPSGPGIAELEITSTSDISGDATAELMVSNT